MFKEAVINRDVNYIDNGWLSRNQSFDSPLRGVENPSDYPFKKYFINSDAPVFEDSPSFPAGPPNLIIRNVQVAIQQGSIYDLSRIEDSKTRPLIINKLRNGTFKIFTGSRTLVYEKKDFDRMRVPITINSSLMKPLDFKDYAPNTLSSEFFFNEEGSVDLEKAYRMTFYLLLKKSRFANDQSEQLSEEQKRFSRIISAEIISYKQLKGRGVFNSSDQFVQSAPYMKDKILVDFFNLSSSFSYYGVGKLSQIPIGKLSSGFNLSEFDSVFRKEYLKSLTGRSTQIFGMNKSFTKGLSFIDDLYIRI
jgi:hypothetical protein